MEHFIGLSNENEFNQFRRLMGCSQEIEKRLIFKDGKVWLQLGPNSPAFTLLTLARLQGQLQGFLVAWRHCESLLNDMFNGVA